MLLLGMLSVFEAVYRLFLVKCSYACVCLFLCFIWSYFTLGIFDGLVWLYYVSCYHGVLLSGRCY